MADDIVPHRDTPRFSQIERKREGRVFAIRPYAAVCLVLFGLAVFGGELFMYFFRGISMSGGVSLVGASLGFIGFYMLNHQDTKDGAQFLVTNGIAIVGAIRGGRRKSDPPVVTSVATPEKPE